MAFRGYFALDGVEFANSSRVADHLGLVLPTRDLSVFGGGDYSCGLVEDPGWPGLAQIPASSVSAGTGLVTIPDGSRRYDEGLIEVGDQCWDLSRLCGSCSTQLLYDDSWPGLAAMLGDTLYRVELAPWYTTRAPESGEFGGVWVMEAKGFGPAPVDRPVTEMSGSGAAAGVSRDKSRVLQFEALLIACTNAGLEYGLEWLTTLLRSTNRKTDAVLRYLAAHPSISAAEPAGLIRELHGVVLTQEPQVSESISARARQYEQATMYRVQFQLTALQPYAYAPVVREPVVWDTIELQPIEWVHAADCPAPADCTDMPLLFSTDDTCNPQPIPVVAEPPPSCGGCMPVCEVDTHVFEVPTMDYAYRSQETVVTMEVVNNGERGLTIQAYWRRCTVDAGCDNNVWPVQINGLPPVSVLTLDGIRGRYWVFYDGAKRRAANIVSTPSGGPWRPPVIDRRECWELVVVAPGDADFDVTLYLADREA